jgi:predicted small metal-binding protein
MDCPGAFKTESQEELMEHVELHGARAHPEMKLDEATRQQLASLVKQD